MVPPSPSLPLSGDCRGAPYSCTIGSTVLSDCTVKSRGQSGEQLGVSGPGDGTEGENLAENCRVDPQKVLFSHPQLPASVVRSLQLPALIDVVTESLDPSHSLRSLDAIQVPALLMPDLQPASIDRKA